MERITKFFRSLSYSNISRYRLALYACSIGLFTFPVLESMGLIDAHPFEVALVVTSLYFIGKIGSVPQYSASRRDAITNLPIREDFIHNIETALTHYRDSDIKTPVVVLVVNINGFKHVNESLGYQIGDSLLNAVGERLQALISNRDVIARIGSDEFGIVLKSASIGYMVAYDKISAAFREPFVFNDGVFLTVGVAVGVAIYPDYDTDALGLLRNASVAVRHAKRVRLGCAVYEPSMSIVSVEKIALASALRRAIENNQFEFYYQPQVDAKTNKVVGVEALIRWNHPTMGLVSPDKFIELAEQTNQIGLLTSWTLHEGIRRLADFRKTGHDITVSINISPFAIINSDILVTLTQEMMRNTIPYRSLMVEITESSIKQSPEDMSKVIACLDMLGIRLSIDDFGTGHASLLYIKHLPIHEIKIDRSFVTNLVSSKQDQAIVKSTIALAHGLDCIVVAEGVEDQATRDLLTELGCDILQGYLISKPMPESDFLKWIETHK